MPAAAVPHADGPRLLADIGATFARFTIETAPGEFERIEVFNTADFSGLEQIVQAYCSRVKVGGFNHAAIAIANPIDEVLRFIGDAVAPGAGYVATMGGK